MLLKYIFVLVTGLAAFGVAAPVTAADDSKRDASLYGTAHTLKMAEDEYKKRDASLYGNSHTLKMAEDEFKKRDASLYGSAHTLKMAEDEY